MLIHDFKNLCNPEIAVRKLTYTSIVIRISNYVLRVVPYTVKNELL